MKGQILPWRYNTSTVKPLNNGHLRVLKNLSVIKRCPLLGGSLTKIVIFGLNILSAIEGMSACPLYLISMILLTEWLSFA